MMVDAQVCKKEYSIRIAQAGRCSFQGLCIYVHYIHIYYIYFYIHIYCIFICIHVVKQPASIVAPLSSIRCFRVGKPDRSRQWILQRREPMVGWLFEKMSGSQSEWISRWWFQTFLFSPLYLGKWSKLTNIFSKGLKPPTRYWWFMCNQSRFSMMCNLMMHHVEAM